jgi:glycosyltransferase involved in cell wall biosynthesis
MACGIPCVVTDVGDSAWLVENTGRVVDRSNPVALCAAWMELLSLDHHSWSQLGRAARVRIVEHFSLDSVVAQYERLYTEILCAA